MTEKYFGVGSSIFKQPNEFQVQSTLFPSKENYRRFPTADMKIWEISAMLYNCE